MIQLSPGETWILRKWFGVPILNPIADLCCSLMAQRFPERKMARVEACTLFVQRYGRPFPSVYGWLGQAAGGHPEALLKLRVTMQLDAFRMILTTDTP